MSHSNASERPCPACGEGRLEAVESTQQVEHAGIQGVIPLHYAVCDMCGSEVAEAPEARANKRAMTAFRKRAEGLLTGAEMREARCTLGLTQAQAAELFGGGKVGFSRYENDEVSQSEAMDNLVRICLARPEILPLLAGLKAGKTHPEAAQHPGKDGLASERISAIKRTLESQIASGRMGSRSFPEGVERHATVVDIQRWMKDVA